MSDCGSEFGPLASATWLLENIGAPDLKIIDGSWRMPGEGAARDDFNERHIPGAVFFDIDAIADQSSALPHMAPSPQQFEHQISALGISNTDRVIVYDDQGIFSAARVWWTFHLMGHPQVAALDGGLPAWIGVGGAVTDQESLIKPTKYKASPQLEKACDSAAVRIAINANAIKIIDARPAARFSGATPEPRAGLRSGAMPGALNVPFGALLRDNKTMRPPEEIIEIFKSAGAGFDQQIITTCGSGVTAAILSLALETAGHHRHSLYDGSWADWGAEHGDEASSEEQFPVIKREENTT